MKTFEERYTAWIDGKLDAQESAAFEQELEAHPEALAEKEAALKIGDLLRRYSPAPVLSNADFFNQQIMDRIAAEQPEKAVAAAAPVRRPVFGWLFQPLGWMAATACVLVAGFGTYKLAAPRHSDIAALVAIGPTPNPVESERPYSAEIVSAESTDPDISVTPIHSDEDKVTVLWVDGLNYLPTSYRIQ